MSLLTSPTLLEVESVRTSSERGLVETLKNPLTVVIRGTPGHLSWTRDGPKPRERRRESDSKPLYYEHLADRFVGASVTGVLRHPGDLMDVNG